MVRRLAYVLVVVFALTLVSYLLQFWRFSHHVAVPPSNAAPTAVVEAFVAAVNAHDCNTAASIWPERGGLRGPGRSWCEDLQSLSVQNFPAFNHSEDPRTSAGSYSVSTKIKVHPRLFHDNVWPRSGDPWSWVLKRTPTGWRIADAGEP